MMLGPGQFTITEVTERSPELIAALTQLWEQSVRATHDFRTEADILQIREYVPQAFAAVQRLYTAVDHAGEYQALMGTQGQRLEMLFVRPTCRGQGLGRRLCELAAANGVREVTVNEQNPAACGFYRHLGFEICRRTQTDEQGRPFPLLYMLLKTQA